MSTGSGPAVSHRHLWLPESVALIGVAIATTAAFAFTNLDVDAARWFYHPGLADPWPVANRPLWALLYGSAPWVTGSLAVVGVALLIGGVVRRSGRSVARLHGIFILLCVAVGPGLIVNGILKDHWGRPRPRQIIEFGGNLRYEPPLLPSDSRGKSFPCGHCSVGYLYGAGWWLWRRRHPRWALASLTTGVAIGTLLGVGRMAAGAHFLSDVVWSALIAFGTAHVLYYHVLRIPAREDALAEGRELVEYDPRFEAATVAGALLLGLGIVGGGLLATPHYRDLTARVPLSGLRAPPSTIDIAVDTLDVEIRMVASKPDEIVCRGSIHGFGWPTSEIAAKWEAVERPVPTLRYAVVERGWFTDLDGIARIDVPWGSVDRIVVRVHHGDIRVVDARGRRVVGARWPVLDLHTDDGRVEGQ